MNILRKIFTPEIMAIGAIALTAHSVYLVRKSEPADFSMVEVTGATVLGMLAAVSLFANEAEKQRSKTVHFLDPTMIPDGVQAVFFVTGTNKKIDPKDFPVTSSYSVGTNSQNKNSSQTPEPLPQLIGRSSCNKLE